MIKGLKKKVSVLMPLELYNTLREQAKEDCRSIPSLIRLILWEHTKQKALVPPQEKGPF